MTKVTPQNISSKHLLISVIIFGLFITAAATISGYLIGSSLMRFKINDRTITVKGLVEKSVTADRAIWTIPFETNAETFNAARKNLQSAKTAVREFLKHQGFDDHEISFTTTAVKDRATLSTNKNFQADVRFNMEAEATIETEKIKHVQKAFSEIDEIITKGVLLKSTWESKHPDFLFTKFNDLRPQMIREAVTNAQKMAIQFSKDTGIKIGTLRQANQGQFQIFGKNNENEHEQKKSVEKTIRIVSTLLFDVEK